MNHEKRFFPISFAAILIVVALSATLTTFPVLGKSTQYSPENNSSGDALHSVATSKKGAYKQNQAHVPVSEGKASFYANQFHGRKTANGETFNMNKLTAAHPSLPFGTWVRVTNLRNGKEVIVRINDRGPYVKGRVIDLSVGAAKEIGLLKSGITKVKLEALSSGQSTLAES